MKEIPGQGLSPEAITASESAWMKENLAQFWATAYGGYLNEGRGVVVVDTRTEPLGDDTALHYFPQRNLELSEDEVNQQMSQLMTSYQPDNQFIAVFVRAESKDDVYSMFQMQVAPELVEAAQAYQRAEVTTMLVEETSTETILEPPDLETLMAWEEEGGCEATDGCWVEGDGICSHGKPSWLLELGLI